MERKSLTTVEGVQFVLGTNFLEQRQVSQIPSQYGDGTPNDGSLQWVKGT